MGQSSTTRILLLLKTEGPQVAAAIGAAFGITAEAARQQLMKMAETGLVRAEAVARAGRGRPHQVWHLTEAGNRRFPDGHAALTVDLLALLSAELGPMAVEAVISAREVQTEQRYSDEIERETALADRVRRLAAIRTREGYMADCWEAADGSFVLVENHCPICAAASACAGFCRSELETFRAVLGAKVDRTEHILLGARRCAYIVRPA